MFWTDINNMQRELEKMFSNDYFRRSTCGKGGYPAFNLFEKNDELVLKAEIPGLEKRDLKVTLENDVINIQGEMKPEERPKVRYHRRERANGTFNRSFNLPYHIKSEPVDAEFSNGVLTVTLEKHESAKSKTITIK